MRIVLILPGRRQIQLKGEKAEKVGKPWIPPTPLMEVAGMMPKDHEIIIYDELAKGPLTADTLPEADLYGLSGLSTSRYGAERVAEIIHEKGKKVIAGGMDVTGQFHEGRKAHLLENYDSIVVGRLTKRLWLEIIGDFKAGKLKKVYSVQTDEPWEFSQPRYDLINPKDYFLPSALRSSAGCTEACPFCTVHMVIGKRSVVKYKSAKMLEKEIANLPKSYLTIDYSDSFGSDYKHTVETVLPLYKASKRRWVTEITVKNLMSVGPDGKRMVERMAENGCAGVYIGIENPYGTISGKSLAAEKYEEAIQAAHKLGLMVMGSFILDVTGEETAANVKRTVDWIIKNKVDFIQYSLTALLPGSITRKVAIKQNRIIDDNPEHMDGAWPTIKHVLSPKKRIELLEWAYETTYSWTNTAKRLAVVSTKTSFSWKAVITAANIQIHRALSRWKEKANYGHWAATKEAINA